ncbi:MAG: hypothetical protein IPJ41_02090 [Phycisphaerales bacterium]|nr:hypothetical protein [Phycisphaerales bacterium]
MVPTRSPRLPLTLLALAASAGLAQPANEGVLRGPTVKPREVPGVQEQYVPGDLGRFASRERPTPLPVFIQELRQIAAPDAPEAVRLSGEQADAIRAELRAFAEDAAAFLKAHGPEIRQLAADLPREQRPRVAAEVGGLERATELLDRIERAGGLGAFDPRTDRKSRSAAGAKALPEKRRPATGFELRFDEPAPPPEMDPDGQPMMQDEPGETGAIERLQALRNAAPSLSAVETRVWQLLNEAQRDRVGAAIDEERQVEDGRLEDARLKRLLAKKTPESPAPNSPGTDLPRPVLDRMLAALDGGEIPDELWTRLPERVRDRLGSLPENERADALRRFLRSRLKDESGDNLDASGKSEPKNRGKSKPG